MSEHSAFPRGAFVTHERDGFRGAVIGHYTTLEGEEGVVVQQHGTKVVHVYRAKWLEIVPCAPISDKSKGDH